MSFCAVHREVESARTCHRCGAFACVECCRQDVDRWFCAACWPRIGKSDKRLAALVLGIVGFAMPLFAVLSIAIGARQLVAIASGGHVKAGLPSGVIAVCLGTASVLLWGLLVFTGIISAI